LNEKEVKALKECLQIIRPFSEFDFQDEAMKTIKKLMEEIRPELNHNEAPIIGFDRVVNSEGWKLISTMYKAIQEKQVLKFDFHPFRDEPIQYFEEVHPYYLHEYNNRWFLFALCKCQEEEYSIYKFGLERIQKISSCLDVPFIPNTLFSSTEFFKNKVGVSSAINKKDDTIEKVILSFPKNRGLYVVSKPIHPSQKVILETENEIRIQLEVIINFELVREIVSFMDAVTVLEPEQLRNKVHEKLVQSIKNYASEFPAKTFNDSRVMSPYIAPKENPSTENIPSPSSGPKENNFQKIDQELDTQIHKEILEKLENGLKDFYNKKDKKK